MVIIAFFGFNESCAGLIVQLADFPAHWRVMNGMMVVAR